MSKNFLSNIKKAQDYTFAGGLKGLEAMAKRATELKLDMGQAFAFADKVSTVEGAISTAAGLQVLGGPFTQFSDAMAMLQEGLTDPAKLQERMVDMMGGMGFLNKQTGEVEVSAYNRQRIKAAAQQMGVNYSDMMEMVYANTRGDAIQQQAKENGIFATNKDYMNLIRNVGTFEKGSAGAYVERNGEMQFVKATEMTAEDVKNLVELNKSDSENVQDIAKTLRGWDDIISGTKKQIEGAKANAVERMGIGKGVQDVVRLVGESNSLLSKIAIASVLSAGIGVIGGGWTMLRGGARAARGIGNIFGRSRGVSVPNTTMAGSSGTAASVSKGVSGAGSVGGGVAGGVGRASTFSTITKGIAKHPKLMLGVGKSALKTIGAGAGLFSGLFTGLEEFGMDNTHRMDRKIRRTAGSAVGGAIGATLGSIIGPLGAMIGGAVGSELGKVIVGGNDKRRERKRKEFGLEYLNGDYSVSELRAIKNGTASSRLKRKMERSGDKEFTAFEKQQMKSSGELNSLVGDIYGFLSGNSSNVTNGKARGGMVYGAAGKDKIPAFLSPNEFVMSEKAVRLYGTESLTRLNSSAINGTGFKNGGLIKP